MKSKKINKILEIGANISEPTNKWITLPFSLIILNQDTNYYVSENEDIFYFDSENELMYIAKLSNNKTVDLSTKDKEDFDWFAVYQYDIIAGFIKSLYRGPESVYYKKF